MKKLFALVAVSVITSIWLVGDDGSTVHWKSIVGVVTAPGVDNVVAGISSGLFPWRASGGNATVNLATGNAEFKVSGLVLVGTNFSGTRADLANVKGTLVCNTGTASQAAIDTATVPLSDEGNAEFAGNLGSLPSPCANPLFLIRLPGNNRWIATGVVRLIAE